MDDDDNERRRGVRDLAYDAHIKATVVETKLQAHIEEDQRILRSLSDSIATLNIDIKGILKWIWIATGFMTAVSQGLNFFVKH